MRGERGGADLTRVSEVACVAPRIAIEGLGGDPREGALRRGCVTLGSTLIEDAFRCGRRMIHEDARFSGGQVTNSSHVKTNGALLDERHDGTDERHGLRGARGSAGSGKGEGISLDEQFSYPADEIQLPIAMLN